MEVIEVMVNINAERASLFASQFVPTIAFYQTQNMWPLIIPYESDPARDESLRA